ncbi:large ribosomal subunit protein bL21c [Ziziphus jujuba]|uniref:Large ribosomal subunit protein bL21c n=2 Tax=Ziziphus jujuba TaxID=326968 RepID=A0A6P4BCS8_ZIZJJ|nr:large ribosomal subunit protein bL21c [Ziziphus jujuba]KAH7524981.1 hypothetical protein FEM48_Zijuj06G0176900 [Ziziphus jujuba var. spinosa]
MASATLSLCSSLALNCRISSQKSQNPLLFNPNLTFLSLSSYKLPLSSAIASQRPTFPFLSKSSESDTAIVEAAETNVTPVPEAAPEPAASQTVEATSEPAPKREEVFAVVMIGSRQYIVFPGRYLSTQRLKGANVNDKIVLNKVLLVGTKTSTYIGKPVVTNAAVHAVVEDQGLDSKVVVFKYKKKKNYRRNIGHRQPNTRIRITGITGYQDYPAVTLDS